MASEAGQPSLALGGILMENVNVLDSDNSSSQFLGSEDKMMMMSMAGEVKLVSEEITDWVENVLNLLMLVICLVAMATNAINLRVFHNQGMLSSSITLCLFSLSFSDLFGAACLIPHCCCRIAKLYKGELTFTSCNTITLLTSTSVHTTFFSISCWITVYMSVERSLCVLMPMKVKLFLTPKTTAISLISFSVFFISTHTYVSSHLKLVWRKVPHLNTSFAIPYKSPYAAKVIHIGSILLFTFLISLAIVIVLIATLLMLHQLNKSRKWRQSTSTKMELSDKSEDNGTREKPQKSRDMEVVKTVTTVTSIFLICIVIGSAPALGAQTVSSLTHSGTNKNLMSMLSTIRYFFDAVNECVNFFFYVKVSSRYKATFSTLYPRWFKDSA